MALGLQRQFYRNFSSFTPDIPKVLILTQDVSQTQSLCPDFTSSKNLSWAWVVRAAHSCLNFTESAPLPDGGSEFHSCWACGKGSSPATHACSHVLQPRGAWDALFLGSAPQLPVGNLFAVKNLRLGNQKWTFQSCMEILAKPWVVATQDVLSSKPAQLPSWDGDFDDPHGSLPAQDVSVTLIL